MKKTNKKVAKYLFIEDYFIKLIEARSLRFNDKIPTEQELCKQFDTSRMTVNKALSRLANKGYVKRITGVGTFVTNQRFSKSIQRLTGSMTEDIKTAGLMPSSTLLEYKKIKAIEKPNILRRLKLKDSDEIHYFAKLRYGDNKPVALTYTFFSCKILPDIDAKLFEGSINKLLDDLNINRTHCFEEYTSVMPTLEHSSLLGLHDVSLLKRTLLWYVGGTPFEYTVHYILGNKIIITNEYSSFR